ncbi:MAG: family 20 glycosylhydrolase [Phycisphaerae bacterium]|nr:family 20 glycosylhydrolase [Phycisphaerae bacterium]
MKVAASQEQLLPRPRRVRHLPGVYRLRSGVPIFHTGGHDGAAAAAARRLRDLAASDGGFVWTVGLGSPEPGALTIEQMEAAHQPGGDQWYSLRIRPDGIRLRAVGAAGLRYGVLTLGQLTASGCGLIRAMDIEDWPDFAVRGAMLDISRDKVPTLSTLKSLIDLLAAWKINQLQLYTEHTFAYAGHERVWRGASPLTGGHIEQLDRYCRDRCIELVPNQNSFGHMERWLRHAPYADLAETDGQWQTPWGEVRNTPSTLNPLDPGSIRLVSSLYDQLLPHFSSRLFNVGCDETWELGQGRSKRACRRRGVGRVYLDFLLKIRQAVRRRGRRMMFWADIAQQHPELIDELPRDSIPLVWGYEADHPFDVQCGRLAGRGLDFYVCPGTSSWCSFGGRTRNCLANLRNAAASGRRHGAAGYLITDWGDFGHRQYLPASYCGFLYGAAVSWCGRTNMPLDAARELARHAFHDPSGVAGQLWCEAGAVHDAYSPQPGPGDLERGHADVSLRNRTILFECMRAPLDIPPAAIEGLSAEAVERMERRAAALLERAAGAGFGGSDGELIREELLATLSVLRHACRRAGVMLMRRSGRSTRRQCRALANDMARIMDRHRWLWLARNRRGGLASSVGHYRRNLREYERGCKEQSQQAPRVS